MEIWEKNVAKPQLWTMVFSFKDDASYMLRAPCRDISLNALPRPKKRRQREPVSKEGNPFFTPISSMEDVSLGAPLVLSVSEKRKYLNEY